jgi:hypothetical protein
VNHPPQRPGDLPHLLDPERPDLRVLALQAEPVERDTGQMALRALAEDRDPGGDVRAGLEVRESLAVTAATLVAGAHAPDPPVGDEQLLRCCLREHGRACLLGALAQPARQL